MEDFKEWFREHEVNKYSHDVQRCLNPNNCTINYIRDAISEYSNIKGLSNEDRIDLINYISENSNDFSKITNVVWEKAYREMQQEINEALGYEKNTSLFNSYKRLITHKMPEKDVQQMLKNENVQKEWAPLLNNELNRMEKNGLIESLVMDVKENNTLSMEESGLIRFSDKSVFQYSKAYDNPRDFQTTLLYEHVKDNNMLDLFDSIKASQEELTLNIDKQSEENKQLAGHCSELEDEIEHIEEDLADLKNIVQEKKTKK